MDWINLVKDRNSWWGVLSTRCWTFGLRQMREMSWLAEELSAY